MDSNLDQGLIDITDETCIEISTIWCVHLMYWMYIVMKNTFTFYRFRL